MVAELAWRVDNVRVDGRGHWVERIVNVCGHGALFMSTAVFHCIYNGLSDVSCIDVSFVWQSESSCSFGRYYWRRCLYCSGIGTISRIAAGAGTSARSLVLYEHNY